MNYLSRTLLLSMLFVSGVKASCSLDNAIRQRIYFKQCLDAGKIVVSSQVITIREGVYWLRGNGYLVDEIYSVPTVSPAKANLIQQNEPKSWIKKQLDKGVILPSSIALQLDVNVFWIYESKELYIVGSN